MFPLGVPGIFNSTGGVPRDIIKREWLFDNNYLDTSGNSADLSANSTILVSDRKSAANSALGINSSVARSSFGISPTSSDFSISFWTYQLTAGWGTCFSVGPVAQSVKTVQFRLYTTSIYCRWLDAINNDTSGTISPALSLNTWHFVVLNFNSVSTKIETYINNAFYGNFNNYNGLNGGGDTTIDLGRNTSTTPLYLNGYLDDFRIFNRMLTLEEITILFNE